MLKPAYSEYRDGQWWIWDVERLWRLAEHLPIKTVPLATITDFDEAGWFPPDGVKPTCRVVATHSKRICGADFTHPIILSAKGYLMDGMHRLAKAWILGMEEVQVVQFEEDPEPDQIGHEKGWETSKATLLNESRPSASEPGRESESGLSPEFWARFVENHWRQGPCVFKGIFPAPLLTTEDAFRGMVTAGEQYRADVRSHHVRFYVEHALQQAEIGEYLPEAGDRSIEGYAERINRKLKGRLFGLIINDFQVYDAALYMRLRDFLRGLYEFIDIPINLVETGLFLGNYKCTPFGPHYDDVKRNTNFTFVLAGRKRVLLWPLEFFTDQILIISLDYERYRDQAIVLEGEPGDLLCWPSDYWHVAESCDSFPVTLSLAHRHEPQSSLADPFCQVGRLLDERLRASSGAKLYSYNLRDRRKNARKLPKVVASTTRVLRELGRDKQLEQMLRVSWLNRITGFGFRTAPPPLQPEPLAEDCIVRGDPRYPIMWLRAEDDEIVCSANGHAFSVAAHPRVLKMLERLNSGEAYRVGDLVRKYKGTVKRGRIEFEATAKDIRAILEKLYSLRSISSCQTM